MRTRFQLLHMAGPGAGMGAPSIAPPAPPPAAPSASSAGDPPAPPAAPLPAGASAPAGSPPAPPPEPSQYSFPEDRANWLSPEQAAQQRTDAIREARAQADRFRAMAEAAAGIKLPSEQPQLDPRVAEARATMERIYPGLGQLYEALPYLMPMVQSLQQARIDPRQFAALPDVFSSVDVQWRQHGAATLAPIHDGIATDLGVDTLSPRQRDAITRDFIAWLEEDQTGARMDRYTSRDARISTEYLTDYRSSFIHPLQRTGTAPAPGGGAPRAAGLPPAPRSGSAPGSALPPVAPPMDLDAATDNAWKGFLAATGSGR